MKFSNCKATEKVAFLLQKCLTMFKKSYTILLDREESETMYFFKQTEKAKVLQGRTITYLAKNKLFVSNTYLTQILNGTRGCSQLLARNICNCISWDAKFEDYFEKKGE